MCGVDLTLIDGIDTTTALKVISEIGPDLSRFKSAKHFTSWLGLCPGTKISGGKMLSGVCKRTTNRAAQALKMAASALRRSQSALGAYYRRMCARLDRPQAITATAHKLARLIYAMLTNGTEYMDQVQDYYERCYQGFQAQTGEIYPNYHCRWNGRPPPSGEIIKAVKTELRSMSWIA